jgi:hypothetical protein
MAEEMVMAAMEEEMVMAAMEEEMVMAAMEEEMKDNNIFSSHIIRRKYYQYATKEEEKLCTQCYLSSQSAFNFISPSVCMFPTQ